MTMQSLIVGIIIVLAVLFVSRWLWGKFQRTCNCGCGSPKKTKSTRASLTIGGKNVGKSKSP